MGPTLVALGFAGAAKVAFGQGTISFSGAQTFMQTVHVRTSVVEIQVELPDAVQFVAEETVCSVGC
ncbi:MAG TPA: hypothetical protein VK814_15245 [Acidobacteriaceae bacterium]|nr:hypothetical protein [Acidobacteriaceae bacterium]